MKTKHIFLSCPKNHCENQKIKHSVKLWIVCAISKFTKKDTKHQHRWIGFKNDRQSLPVRCLPDQILCPDGVQRNGSNADASVLLGTVS